MYNGFSLNMRRQLLLMISFVIVFSALIFPKPTYADTTYTYKGVFPAGLDTPVLMSNATSEEVYYSFAPQVSGQYYFSRQVVSGFNFGAGPSVSLTDYLPPIQVVLGTSVSMIANPDYPNGFKAKLKAGKTYYLFYTGTASSQSSSKVTISRVYQNIDLYTKTIYQSTPKLISKTSARLYSDGRKFVNLQGKLSDVSGLSNGIDYIQDDEGIWLSENYLKSNPLVMNVTSTTSSITITVNDSDVIAMANGSIGNVTVAAAPGVTQTASSRNSKAPCNPNCDYTIYLMAGINTTEYGMWEDAIQEIPKHYGSQVQMYTLFPYGFTDGKSGLKLWALIAAQANNVSDDYGVGFFNQTNTPQRILDEKNFIKNNYGGGKKIIIGHSGGGIAGARTAQYLMKNDPTVKIDSVVMVGSPETDLNVTGGDIRTKTTHIRHVDDPIATLQPFEFFEPWGGYPPANVLTINLAPGSGLERHASYFSNISWSNGTRNNVEDTLTMIYNKAH